VSDFRVLQELSHFLRGLLLVHLVELDALNQRFTAVNNISLDSPARIADGSAPNAADARLSLYLYQATPNAHTNNRGYIPAGAGVRRFPPLSLNLYYLLTPLNSSPDDALLTLGCAMQVLAAHPVIRANFLGSQLYAEQPEVKLSVCSVTVEELTRIWNAFNQPYRLSLCYQVQSVTLDSLRQPEVGPPVMEQLVDVQQITGRRGA
jgi:hypothetical protein